MEVILFASQYWAKKICGDLGTNSKTPNRKFTRRLRDQKCIDASHRIQPLASRRVYDQEKKKKDNGK